MRQRRKWIGLRRRPMRIRRGPKRRSPDRRDARGVNEAIERLPPAYREIIILREMDEMSYREIADIVGVPIGTVMSRLARGRQMLQTALRKLGYGSELS